MLDFSAAFRKTKDGKYHFFPGTVFSRKAYIVTYKEKGIIEEIIESSFKKTMLTTMPGTVLACININIFIFFMLFMLFIILFDCKRKIRNILGNRTLVISEPLGLINQINRKVNKMTKGDFKQSLHLFLFALGWTIYLIYYIFIKKNYDLIIIFPFLFFCVGLLLFSVFLILYLKRLWKDRAK